MHSQKFSSKVKERILSNLDFHNLLNCRLVSKNMKSQVDKLAEGMSTDRNLNWNPYFTVRKYFDVNSKEILGLIRLQCLDDVKRFVEENTQTNTVANASKVNPKTPPTKQQGKNSNSVKIAAKPPATIKASNVPAKNVPAKSMKPSTASKPSTPLDAANSNGSLESKSKKALSTTPSKSNRLFPQGAVYIRRRLDDYEDDKTHKMSVADSNTEIVRWSTRLVKEFGTQLTSLTLDTGKRAGSEVTFMELRAILTHVPNLIFLGITSGDYEHHNFELSAEFPSLPQLKYVWLGYNTTYHLQMDIFNSYSSQLKRFVCSRFGYFFQTSIGPSNISTNNSLVKLLDYANCTRPKYPDALSSLEELKVPILSTQNLMHEIELVTNQPDLIPIRWSNLKRLSLHYYHHANFNDSCLADLWSFLNTFSGTLEEFCLDFEGCRDFLKWLTVDPRPMEESVFKPCPKVRKLCISTISLLEADDMVGMISSKFPNLEILTFFNWWMYHAEANQSSFQGVYSSGPKIYNVNEFVAKFWSDNLPNLQRASVRIATWKDEILYEKTRNGTNFFGRFDFPVS